MRRIPRDNPRLFRGYVCRATYRISLSACTMGMESVSLETRGWCLPMDHLRGYCMRWVFVSEKKQNCPGSGNFQDHNVLIEKVLTSLEFAFVVFIPIQRKHKWFPKVYSVAVQANDVHRVRSERVEQFTMVMVGLSATLS